MRVARGHRGFPTTAQPAPKLLPRRQDPEERDPKRVRFTAATSDHTPGNEAAPRGRADLQALALSHPRWAAATARGRAAPSIVSAVRAHGGGLRAIAAGFSTLPTPRSKKRDKAARAYGRVCQQFGDNPWPRDAEQLVQQLIGFGIFYCERGGAHTSVSTYIGGLLARAAERGYDLTPSQRQRVAAATAALGQDFPHEPRRSTAMSLDDRVKLVTYLQPEAALGNLHAIMWIALITLMGALMTRLCEVADTACRWSRVTRNASDQLAVLLPWRKNSKDTFSVVHSTFTVPHHLHGAAP